MITIIFAPPRTGKTCFMTHQLNELAFERERIKLMEREIKQKPHVRHWEGDLYANSGLSEMEMTAKKSSQWLTNSPLRDYVNGGSVAKTG